MLIFSFSTIWKGWLWLRGDPEVREAGAQRPGFASANWAFPYHYHTFSYIPHSLACICIYLLFCISLSLPYIFLPSVFISLYLSFDGHFLIIAIAFLVFCIIWFEFALLWAFYISTIIRSALKTLDLSFCGNHDPTFSNIF